MVRGIPEGVFILSLDITQMKRAAEAQRRSEELYRRIVETTSEGVAMTDATSRINYANARFAQMLGYEVSEVLGKRTLDLMDPVDQARYAAGDFAGAATLLEKHVGQAQRDKTALVLLDRCRSYASAPPSAWDGVVRLG